MTSASGRWDLFCRVVDNFGDIGVCWRLARLLVREHGIQVRLITDRPELLQRITARPDPALESSNGGLLRVVRWRSSITPGVATGVVIEAFACELPATYAHAMAASGKAPLWINLEYLSAEAWVAGCHGLASRHPSLGLEKRFFFPGFEAATGGLLREAGLLERRQAFRRDPAALAEMWGGLGVSPPAARERRASLFGYENPVAFRLAESMAAGDRPWTLLVPEGRSLPELAAWAQTRLERPGDTVRRGALTVVVVPFTSQDAYDRLLWACDLNLVRGEDSLVRAIWAGRPFLWQAYLQDDAAHLDKVRALAARLADHAIDDGLDAMLRACLEAWNGAESASPDWPRLLSSLEGLAAQFEAWCRSLAAGPELAAALVKLAESRLK